VVLPDGSDPESDEPRRIEKNGIARASISSAATPAMNTGRARSIAAQRAQPGDSSLVVNPPLRSARRALRPSTRVPIKPRSAGSRVNAAITVPRTATLAATATP